VIDVMGVLTHVSTHLEDDLSLGVLADRAGSSPMQLHRAFLRQVGETPRRHVERARLERAAVHLLLRDASILDIAIEHGFQSHEVFTRAFRRHFGRSPTAWRSDWRGDGQRRGRRAAGPDGPEPIRDATLSATRIHDLRPVPVACIRHTGPYEDVPLTLWDELLSWAARRHLPAGPLLGVAHDAPGLVPPARLRFDACMVVPEGTTARAGEGVGIVALAGGPHAVTAFAGPLGELGGAYGQIVERLAARRDLEVLGLPAVERYLATEILGATLEHIEIALPVRRRGG
jgi:AraC family transcriptional regulator